MDKHASLSALTMIKGIGPKRAEVLAKMGITTLEELINYLPRAYKDLSSPVHIAHIMDGTEAVVTATVTARPTVMRVRRNMTLVKCRIEDTSGFAECVWFNQPYIANNLKPGEKYIFYGKAQVRYGLVQFSSPMYENHDFDTMRTMLPIYTVPKAQLTQKAMRIIMRSALKVAENLTAERFSDKFRHEFFLAERGFALRNIHFPQSSEALKSARRRMVFEDLIYFQCAIGIHKKSRTHRAGTNLIVTDEQVHSFFRFFPFKPTDAQKRTIEQIRMDINGENPMNRMVQGDVGCGKTVAALFAMYAARLNGLQSVFMAPTEILAKQHYNEAVKVFGNEGIGLLSGSLGKSERTAALANICQGKWDMIIGTHALFQNDVIFSNLGMIITDEQHRFGVEQRARLSAKGSTPDVLVMSATPIPRSLSLVLYGDLDVSVIDQLPPGRKKIKTYIIPEHKRGDMYGFVRKHIEAGRQAYIVCPLVEDSEDIEAQSAIQMYEDLANKDFKGFGVGLLHGRMSAAQKNEVMTTFYEGKTQVLIATTVVEVGVNAVNASIMIIEDADRFGLATLHQLRGRVGRGEHESFCFLMAKDRSEQTKERFEVLVNSENGFEVAQRDLELRGPGDFLGTRQHGVPDIRIASFLKDMSLIETAQKALKRLEEAPEYRENFDEIETHVKNTYINKIDQIAMN